MNADASSVLQIKTKCFKIPQWTRRQTSDLLPPPSYVLTMNPSALKSEVTRLKPYILLFSAELHVSKQSPELQRPRNPSVNHEQWDTATKLKCILKDWFRKFCIYNGDIVLQSPKYPRKWGKALHSAVIAGAFKQILMLRHIPNKPIGYIAF